MSELLNDFTDMLGMMTRDDFSTEAPFEILSNLPDDPFTYEVGAGRLEGRARELGVKNFSKLLKAYQSSHPAGKKRKPSLELPDDWFNPNGWTISTSGVTTESDKGAEIVASPTPVYPAVLLEDIETGEQKLVLKYYLRGSWREYQVGKDILASNTKVTALNSHGISVTSRNAADFVWFVQDVEVANQQNMPVRQSVSRCGYFGDKYGFVPYSDKIVFGGEEEFGAMYDAIKPHGSMQDSMSVLRAVKDDSIQARLMLAASLASVLIAPLHKLPFITHLWSVESGNGKSVALMAAASLWADPNISSGQYIKTFDATQVGFERVLGFLNQLPMCCDEYQLARTGGSQFNPYNICQGKGRTRGKASGGNEVTITWQNCFISTGESQMSDDSAGAGEINRIIDLRVDAGHRVVTNCVQVCDILTENYGWIGPEFVRYVYADGNIRKLRTTCDTYLSDLTAITTEKQAMAMSLLLTADEWLAREVYLTPHLEVEDIKRFLANVQEVSLGMRGAEFIVDWISQNGTKFDTATGMDAWGETVTRPHKGAEYRINGSILRKHLAAAGFAPNSVFDFLYQRGVLKKQNEKTKLYTKSAMINGKCTSCIVLDKYKIEELLQG